MTKGASPDRRKDLEATGLLDLVILCGTVATDPSVEPAKREEAAALRIEWVSLQRLPPIVLGDEPAREAELESLRHKMIDLLAIVLLDAA